AEMEKVPFRFDAVFSDVVMPGMGRRELARRLRAHNAEAALAEMEKVPFRFDAVFSDVVMPGMGRRELARRLRA
ncbi:hypothetical protein CTI14_70775, partial [Methylobacterium radiotolerans]